MVTRKDGRNRDFRAALAKHMQDIEDRTIAYRWYVVEITPERENEIGGHIPPKVIKVSDFMESQKDAQAWYDEHVADPGKYLQIRRDRLVTTQVWMRG